MRWRLALVAAAVASHATVLTGGFIWLDHGDLEQRAALARFPDWLGLFLRGYAHTGFYRPITSLSLSLDGLIGSPLLFHAESLGWHAAMAVLCAVVAEELGLNRRAALVAAVLFAMHPATSLVADVITYRGDAIAAVFLLGFLVAYMRGYRALAFLCALLAPLSKETGFIFVPLCLLAIELTPPRSLLHRPTRDRAMPFAVGAALLVAGGMRIAFAPAWRAHLPPLAFGEAIGSRLAALAKSAAAIVLPIDRSICDAFPVTPLISAQALAGLIIAAAVIWLAVQRRGPALLLAATLLQSLDLVAAPRFWSPHYLYLPLAFVAMLVAELLDRRGPRALAMGAFLAVLLGALTLHDGLRYRSDASLFTFETAAHPQCREAHFYLGESEREAGDLEGAANDYLLAATTTPGILSYVDEAAALQNLGIVRLEQSRIADAESAFRSALARVSDDDARRRLMHDLALAAAALGDDAEVVRLLVPETARMNPLPMSVIVLAKALHNLGREDEARALLARLKPEGPVP